MTKFTDIGVAKVGHVGTIEIQRPPLNFFDISLINQIADALDEFDKDIEIRASVLMAQGKAFCAGANFSDPARQAQEAGVGVPPPPGGHNWYRSRSVAEPAAEGEAPPTVAVAVEAGAGAPVSEPDQAPPGAAGAAPPDGPGAAGAPTSPGRRRPPPAALLAGGAVLLALAGALLAAAG